LVRALDATGDQKIGPAGLVAPLVVSADVRDICRPIRQVCDDDDEDFLPRPAFFGDQDLEASVYLEVVPLEKVLVDVPGSYNARDHGAPDREIVGDLHPLHLM